MINETISRIIRTKFTSSPGIYIIWSLLDDRCYIGSSVNLKQRKHQHYTDLEKGGHGNGHLQRFANKYGRENLKIGILETCPKEKLISKEQYWINKINPKFNICRIAGSSLGRDVRPETRQKISKSLIGTRHSEATKKKMSESHKGIPFSEEHKRNLNASRLNRKPWKLSEAAKENIRNGALRGDKNPSKRPEIRAKISKARQGIPVSEEQKQRISDTLKKYYQTNENPFKGKRHSEETRRKISNAAVGRPSPNKGKKASEETRRRISEAAKGRIIEPEQRAKISASLKGRAFSEETRKKLSVAAFKRWGTTPQIPLDSNMGETPILTDALTQTRTWLYNIEKGERTCALKMILNLRM